MAAVVTRGICEFCGQEYSKRGIKRHLDSCAQRPMDHHGEDKYYTLVVDSVYERGYWLYAEVPVWATLQDLDDFLKSIWLHCCGHLSEFRVDGQCYWPDYVDADWDVLSMETELMEILAPGSEFTYEYDFGSTTKLKLRVVSSRIGDFPYSAEVKLLARNIAPEIRCDNCEEMATRYFTEYYVSLCDTCARIKAKAEANGEYNLPIVNSPRSGVCAYKSDRWNWEKDEETPASGNLS